MGGRIGGRTVYITDDSNVIHRLNAGDTVPADLEKYFVSGLDSGHRALASGSSRAAGSDEQAGDEQSADEKLTGGYDSWTVVQLKDALKQRELPQTGAKAELVERLVADDAEDDEFGSGEQAGGELSADEIEE